MCIEYINHSISRIAAPLPHHSATVSTATMSSKSEYPDTDLASLLSTEEQQELVRLISSITESMRASLDWSSNPKRDGSNPPATAESGSGNIPSPHPDKLQRAALASFDTWCGSVLSRIVQAVCSPPPPNSEAAAAAAVSPEASSNAPPDDFLASHYPPHPTFLCASPHAETMLQAVLILLLSLKNYDARSRILLLYVTSSLHLPLKTLNTMEETTAKTLLQAAATATMSAESESASRTESAKSANRWKVGLASVAGAALVGITGGLAAPVVAAGLAGVMGGLGLGATAVAGYLGAVASSSAIVGALFGAYGGRMSGQVMERYAKEVEDFKFIPIRPPDDDGSQRDAEARLRVAVGVTGWVVSGEEEIVGPWRSLGGGVEAYALRWEVAALADLGHSLQTILTSYAMTWVKSEIIKRTVFAALYSALWPVGLLKAARVIDNPFSIARHRSEKAGLVLADAIINKAQGERPVTLVGFSLGSRLIYTCLLSLAERGAFGLIENVVLMGSPVPANKESWKTIRSVVAGRVVNVFSEQDYILAFLYRTSSIQLGVAGLQKVEVKGVENVDAGDLVEGHLRYRFAVGRILRTAFLKGDMDVREVEREEQTLRLLEREDRERKDREERDTDRKGEGAMDDVVSKAARDLDEARRERERERERSSQTPDNPGLME